MDYFNKIDAHLQGQMDIDAIQDPIQVTRIISIGSDDVIRWRTCRINQDDQIDQLQLPAQHGFNKIALHPGGNKFLIGGLTKNVCQYTIITKASEKVLHQSQGQINDIKYSPSGRFVSIATDEQKVIVIDTETSRKTKCRPGHNNCKVLNTFFSSKDRYVASIGEDCHILVYELAPDKDPQQVYRAKITNQNIPFGIKGCFQEYKQGYRIFVPGTNNLQIIQQLINRWEIKKTNIGHDFPIIACEAINSKMLVTSCEKDIIIWSINKQEKIVVHSDCYMTKIIGLHNRFIGVRNDGAIYLYNRDLSKFQQTSQQSQIQAQQEELNELNIGNQEIDQNIQLQYQNNEQGLDFEEDIYTSTKKSRADKIIKVFPQKPIYRQTSFSDEQRFIYICLHGYIIQTRENDEINISVQFRQKNQTQQPQIKHLFKNRKFEYFAINSQMICYANQNQYGVRIDNFSSWEKQWFDIQGIAMGANWIAVANDSQIRILDLSGNLVRSICFDRIIIAMQAYQNLLAVVYHEGVPMYCSQLLSMKIFNVSQFATTSFIDCQVPLTTVSFEKKKQVRLHWFGFSAQGMIFTQDDMSTIRVYSLQTNEWTTVALENSIDPKRVWIIGFEEYNMKFWKVIDTQPQPTVRPRLPIKQTKIMMNSLIQNVDQLQELPNLLWKRYCLDHELARWRLWGIHKFSRDKKNINYSISQSILNQKQIQQAHSQIDRKLEQIIKYYIRNKQTQRALNFVKSYIRILQSGQRCIEVFDQQGQRASAIQLQFYYDEKQREINYEAMQQGAMKQLKEKLQITIKQKKQNPMNPKYQKPTKNNIPYSISQTPQSQSQHSSFMEDITHKVQQNSKVQQAEVIENPFLKKKSTTDKKLEIQEHIQKFAVKKKVEEKKKF